MSMTNTTSKTSLVFFGNERLATATATSAPTLQALINAGYHIEAVIAGHIDPVSRQNRDLEIGPIAQQHNIPVILLGKEDLVDKVKRHRAQAGVLVAFGQLIPPSITELFPNGIINIHPSLLPQYRGPTPVEQAIIDGAAKTGVSLMQVVAGMDTGPLFTYKTVHLTGRETKQELAVVLNNLGAQMLVNALPKILSGELKPKAQPHPDRATYSRKISKLDGLISWNKTAEVLEREVRAYMGWPGSYTQLAGKKVTITQVSIIEKSGEPGEVFDINDGFGVYAGRNALIIEAIKPAGKREMSGADFRRGYLTLSK